MLIPVKRKAMGAGCSQHDLMNAMRGAEAGLGGFGAISHVIFLSVPIAFKQFGARCKYAVQTKIKF